MTRTDGLRHHGLTLVELLAALVILSSVAAAGASILTGTRSAAGEAATQLAAASVLMQIENDTEALLEAPRIVRDASGGVWRAAARRAGEIHGADPQQVPLADYEWVEVTLERSTGDGRFIAVTSALRLIPIEREAAP